MNGRFRCAFGRMPGTVPDELRFHLALTDHLPASPELQIDGPCLVTEPDDFLPGGPVCSLVEQQPNPYRPGSLGQFVRILFSMT
jgi:hypothetical protein